jgi:peptidoglycan/LPS O-acetylase OafA/YrhL
MGLLRFILAVLVVYSHTFEVGEFTHNLFGMHIKFYWGAFAVGLFYMISGFYMEKKFTRVKELPFKTRIREFYFDRSWRIYPTYLICFLISLLYFLHHQNVGLGDLPVSFLVTNILIIPTAFFYIFPGILFREMYLVIPVTPSLAIEEIFFLIFPFIHRYSAVFAALSSLVFASSVAKITNSFFVSYIGVPGTLFLFLSGALISRNRRPPLIPTLVCAISVAFLLIRRDMLSNHLIEMATAFLVGAAVLTLESRRSDLDQKANKVTTWLGTLSYPIFLLHWIGVEVVKGSAHPELVYAIVLALTLPVNYIEGKIQNARRAYFSRRRPG